ncbi:MAG: hypothetical protein H6858_01940 [Rhodospirillales bacterium]|nr:hypothetical protein [Alphaproteobacteria bacterium]MCB9976345.1 hypothetical protein [Rhodospirillales bacterium]
MGSLTSRPKAPTIRTVVLQNPVTPVTEPPPDTTAGQPDAETLAAQARTRDLLTRRRGFLGTIGTSFRGLLTAVGNNFNRKTLFGE